MRSTPDIQGIPKDCYSVKAVGQIYPDGSSKFKNAYFVPGAPIVTAESYKGQFKFNEYVVYDEKKVQPKFLVLLE